MEKKVFLDYISQFIIQLRKEKTGLIYLSDFEEAKFKNIIKLSLKFIPDHKGFLKEFYYENNIEYQNAIPFCEEIISLIMLDQPEI